MQQPAPTGAQPPKNPKKTWIIVVLEIVALCGCCILVIAAGAGYYYLHSPAPVFAFLCALVAAWRGSRCGQKV
jgi:hypothetical protein